MTKESIDNEIWANGVPDSILPGPLNNIEEKSKMEPGPEIWKMQPEFEDIYGIWTHNNFPCGSGKTYASREIVRKALYNNMKVVYVMPLHELIQTELIEKLGIEPWQYVHVMGKSKLCPRRELNDFERDCNTCRESQTCEYKLRITKQIFDRNLIFIVPQYLFLIPRIKPDVVIIDESLENIYLGTSPVPPGITFNTRDYTCVDCPFKGGRCDPVFKDRNCLCEIIGACNFSIESFDPDCDEQFYFKNALMHSDRIFMMEGKIITRKNIEPFLRDVPTLLFNCATTPPEVANRIFGREMEVRQMEGEMENETIMVDFAGTIPQVERFLPELPFFLSLNDIPDDSTTLIITKKRFKKQVKELLPNVQTTHFGVSRGTNSFERCDNVVILGRFALPPNIHDALNSLTEFDINGLVKAEMMQALHRIRPLLTPSKRIFLLTNELRGLENVVCKRNVIGIAKEIMEKMGELNGMLKSKIYESIKGNHQDVKAALDLLAGAGFIEMKNRKPVKFNVDTL